MPPTNRPLWKNSKDWRPSLPSQYYESDEVWENSREYQAREAKREEKPEEKSEVGLTKLQDIKVVAITECSDGRVELQLEIADPEPKTDQALMEERLMAELTAQLNVNYTYVVDRPTTFQFLRRESFHSLYDDSIMEYHEFIAGAADNPLIYTRIGARQVNNPALKAPAPLAVEVDVRTLLPETVAQLKEYQSQGVIRIIDTPEYHWRVDESSSVKRWILTKGAAPPKIEKSPPLTPRKRRVIRG